MKKRKSFNSISLPASSAINILFVAYCLACLIPLILVISISFSDENSVMRNGYKLIPTEYSLAAYQYLWFDIQQIMRSYGITVFVTVAGTFVSLVLTALYAYPLFRRDFPFRRFFSMFLFITMLFNGGLVPFYILYTQYLGLRNSVLALIIPYLLNPFYVIVMRTFLTGAIPDSLIESAKLDGAKEMRILLRIVTPLALPAFATVGLFTTIVYWNDWFMSMLFMSNPLNVSIQYFMLKTMQDLQFLLQNPSVAFKVNRLSMPSDSVRMAMAVIGIGPIVFVYPFFQKYFIKGLTIGAVKG